MDAVGLSMNLLNSLVSGHYTQLFSLPSMRISSDTLTLLYTWPIKDNPQSILCIYQYTKEQNYETITADFTIPYDGVTDADLRITAFSLSSIIDIDDLPTYDILNNRSSACYIGFRYNTTGLEIYGICPDTWTPPSGKVSMLVVSLD